MRYVAVAVALFVATACFGADEPPKATRVIEGTTAVFPTKSVPDGVKRLTGVLDSCHDISDGTIQYTADDLKKAQKSDHVRFVFSKPLSVKLRGKKLDVSEAIYADGVFWLVCGKDIVRCSKYTHDKWDPFLKWYRQMFPVERA